MVEQARDIELLLRGQTPNGAIRRELTTGLDSLTDFLKLHYLDSYIPEGGSKIKFITGRQGSGKTHLARTLLDDAAAKGYLTASFSAGDIWMHDLKDVYLQILRQCGVERILSGCAKQIVREMGYDPEDIAEGKTFLDYLGERGEGDALSRGEIRGVLRRYFTKNPLLDNSFAVCCSLLTGGMLGHPVLEPATRELLLSYLYGDKAVKLSQLRPLGFTPARITKYNARYLLRSLTEAIRLAGYRGLVVFIDDLDVLVSRGSESAVRYTRLRREDAYENIRQLIDDIDSMHRVMFLLCFDRELIDNESSGMKSYQALWLRIQNEVVSRRFNRFADMIDLDRYADECYDVETLIRMSERLASVLESAGVSAVPINAETAEELMKRAEFGGVGLPYLLNREVVRGGGEND